MRISDIRQKSEALFGQTRSRILVLLFSQPHERFSVGQIARLTGTSVGTVHRELSALVKIDLVSRSPVRKRVDYMARGGPLLPPIMGIAVMVSGGQHQLRTALAPLAAQVSFVFTCYAPQLPGDPNFYTYLVVVGDVPPEHDKIKYAVSRANLGEYRLLLNPMVYTVRAFERKLRKDDPFLRGVIQAEKMFVIGTEDDFKREFIQ
jgi:uncharacterized protein